MRIVIQRVKEAAVKVDDRLEGTIGKGLLVFLGIENDDDLTDVIWLVNKLSNIRIFNDTEGIMNKSLIQESGEMLVISQFTLMALTKKVTVPHISERPNKKLQNHSMKIS